MIRGSQIELTLRGVWGNSVYVGKKTMEMLMCVCGEEKENNGDVDVC